MKQWRKLAAVMAITAVLALASGAQAVELVRHAQGGTLPAPDYGWWYGCAPTSAGMMTGYYDINGYGTASYDNLVPGVVASPLTPYLAPAGDAAGIATQAAIASPGHITDFYSGVGPGVGYLWSGDDLPAPWHGFNSLADFMGTSQDAYGSVNGSTWIYNYTDGSKLHYYEVPGHGITGESGMYGIYEYIDYSSYGSDVVDLYNQYTDNEHPAGFTLADYIVEIDAGRVVLIHVSGHTMLGLGYADANPSLITIDDTWGAGTQTMAWGGIYSGMTMFGVTVLELETGIIPEPCTMSLLGLSLLGLAAYRRRRTA